MWEKHGDSIALMVVACIFVIGAIFVIQAYDAHPHVFQGTFALLILGLFFRSLRRRDWLRRQGCYLQVIHETPHQGGDWDLTITYRLDDNEVRFYGNKASRERRKVIALPPVESWPQIFPSWVCDKRDFILKTLSYHYKVEWTDSTPYPVHHRLDDSQIKNQSAEIAAQSTPPSSSSDSRWNIKKDDPTDYKSRSLIYEEPGFRLVTDLEMSGVSEFNWLGTATALSTWTEPTGIPIGDQKREELLISLASWCRGRNTRLSFSPSWSWEEMLWNYERDGYTIVYNTDGSTTIMPPSRATPR